MLERAQFLLAVGVSVVIVTALATVILTPHPGVPSPANLLPLIVASGCLLIGAALIFSAVWYFGRLDAFLTGRGAAA